MNSVQFDDKGKLYGLLYSRKPILLEDKPTWEISLHTTKKARKAYLTRLLSYGYYLGLQTFEIDLRELTHHTQIVTAINGFFKTDTVVYPCSFPVEPIQITGEMKWRS